MLTGLSFIQACAAVAIMVQCGRYDKPRLVGIERCNEIAVLASLERINPFQPSDGIKWLHFKALWIILV